MNRSAHFPCNRDIFRWDLDPHKNRRLGEKLGERRRDLARKILHPMNGEVPDLMRRLRTIDERLWQLSGRKGPFPFAGSEYTHTREVDPLDDFVPGQSALSAIGYGYHHEDLPASQELTDIRENMRKEFTTKLRQYHETMQRGEKFIDEYEATYGSF